MIVQLQRWFHDGERVEVDELETLLADATEVQESRTASAAVPATHPILVKPLKDGQNFIGFLQELCQTMRWDFPEYEFEGETPEFICRCSVWAEGQRFSGRALSAQKKKAKYFATKVVLLNIQQHFQSSSETEGDIPV